MDKLKKQIDFIIEIDKLKNIYRQTLLMDGSRRENDAEHSWHLALMGIVLLEYAEEDLDLSRLLKMLLIHDLVEVYAGDTFCYDDEGNVSKAQREAEAAERLYGLLPKDQGQELKELWQEFEDQKSPEALFAASLDRLQPLICNYLTEGHTWVKYGIKKDKVLERMDLISFGAPKLWPLVEKMVEDSIEKGILEI